jgi:DNA-binding helix-hairpin-helix protein with protein kinase domain
MFAIGRLISRPGTFPPATARLRGRPRGHRHRWANSLERVSTVLLVLCGLSVAAVLGWLLAVAIWHSPRRSSAEWRPAPRRRRLALPRYTWTVARRMRR